jgi:uncharacterized DUF497 family protein
LGLPDFTWHDKKNTVNIHKHGVSFDEAKTAFLDPMAIVVPDVEHSEDEERFVIIGMSKDLRLLMVCHCYRRNESEIRIISARKASKCEASST